MKANKKALALVLCAVMLVATSIFGTLAYLTDTDNAVTNTFTVGKVEIALDEAKVNLYGNPVDAEGTAVAFENAPRVLANSYKLIPGHTYLKDPTVHVSNDSENCYVFVRINNGIASVETTEAGKTIAEQMAANGWSAVKDETNVYYYNKDNVSIVVAGANLPVFANFTINSANEEITDYSDVVVNAYAIQADGFADVNAAWTALKAELPTT